MKKRLIKLIALVMCAAMLTGCAASGGVKNLTDGVNAADVTLPEVTDYTMIGDLGAGLMQYAAAQEAENPVLSPLSGVAASMAGSFGAQAEAHSITAIITAKSFFIVSSLTKTKDEGDTFILHYNTQNSGSVLIIR